MKTLFATALLVFCATSVNAQDPGQTAREQMGLLHNLLGDYELVVYLSEDDGLTWTAGPVQRVSFRMQQNGLLLEEVPTQKAEQGFHMTTYLTFDQYRKVFRKAAIDDVWGIMDIYHGEIEGGALVLTNLESGTFFPIGDQKWRGFRLTVPLHAGERTMLIEKTDDNGASWQPAFKSVYTPLG